MIKEKKKSYKSLIILLVLIVLGVIAYFIYNIIMNNEKGYNFKIHFFNAGKADAIVFFYNNHYMMIDTGEESLSNNILSYFKENNIKKLDYLIITHFDKDHVGSASSVIDNIEIGEVLQSNYPKESDYYSNYLKSLENKSINPKTIKDNYDIKLDSIDITVNGPSIIYPSNESNNSSLIVTLTHNENKFLFTANAQNPRIRDFLSDNKEKYKFIKMPYHGNYLKSVEQILQDNTIKYAVITSSNTNKEDNETINMLNNYKVKYYLTRNGSIDVLSNGKDIKIKQDK